MTTINSIYYNIRQFYQTCQEHRRLEKEKHSLENLHKYRTANPNPQQKKDGLEGKIPTK